MLKVGLTGGIGSGKTIITKYFLSFGILVIDADGIAYQITQSNGIAIPAIRTVFGKQFIMPNGSLNRTKMREHIFKCHKERFKLDAIMMPLIYKAMIFASKIQSSPYLLIDIPLFLEKRDWSIFVNRILVIDCDEITQIARVMVRNKLSYKQIKSIISTQVTRIARLSIANDVLYNQNKTFVELFHEIKMLHYRYTLLGIK